MHYFFSNTAHYLLQQIYAILFKLTGKYKKNCWVKECFNIIFLEWGLTNSGWSSIIFGSTSNFVDFISDGDIGSKGMRQSFPPVSHRVFSLKQKIIAQHFKEHANNTCTCKSRENKGWNHLRFLIFSKMYLTEVHPVCWYVQWQAPS